MTPPFADARLAARLEGIAARDVVRFAETASALYPDLGAETLAVGGGAALWMGEGSPVNIAVGLGMSGPVSAGDLDAVEAFFASHGGRCPVAVCPLADPSLAIGLAGRGYNLSSFENVLVLALAEARPDDVASGVEVQEISDDLADTWARTVASGFSGSGVISIAEERLARVVATREGSRRFLAFADGVPAGTGELVIVDGVGWFSADATLATYRGRGVQTALQIARLRAAAESGCELAVAESAPGSGSQRNMERRGFRVAYTRAEVVR